MRGSMDHIAEERYRITLQSIGDAVIATDALGRIEMLNPVAEALTGWGNSAARGRPLHEVFCIINEGTRQPVESPVQHVLREGTVVGLANHTLLVARDGSERPIADSGAPIRDASGALTGVVLVFRDQTEERSAQRALSDSVERYRLLFNASPLPMWVYDLETLICLAVNDAALLQYGYSRQEFLAMTIKDIRPAQDLPRLTSWLSHLPDGPNPASEWQHRRKNGSLIEVEISSHTLSVAGRRAQLVQAHDITARKRAERELAFQRAALEQLVAARTQDLVAARDQAEQANRAKSEFLSRMSHELRTPLNAILGFGQLMAMDAGLQEPHRAYVDQTLRAGKHLLELINDVLDLAQIEAGRVTITAEALALGELVEDGLRLLAPSIGQRRIKVQVQAMVGTVVWADRTRLRQVLLNLLSNAVKYNREGGSLTISITPVAAQRLRLSIADTGIGIKPERQAELFEPFNRLGAESSGIEGTGIGLAIARQLIEMMGGSIGVESQPGVGTQFWIELALAAKLA